MMRLRLPTRPGRASFRQRSGHTRSVGVVGMVIAIAVLHLVGWGSLVFLVLPEQHPLFGVGLGLTAYVLGVRHAFDADHIAAIDNITRKLMTGPRRPATVGFWFAVGHSTVVFGLCLILALGIRTLAGSVADQGSGFQSAAGTFGGLVSGVFLLAIGLINFVVLREILGIFRKMRTGAYDDRELERQLDNRGLINRMLRGTGKWIRKPVHIYPLGLLFGLGFDTATEVSLLVLAGGAAAGNLPWYAILTLPALFAAGMTLLDGINGLAMSYAYGWSHDAPVRKVFYNITVTGLSVVVALLVGGIQLIGVLADQMKVSNGPVAWIAEWDLNSVGYVIAGIFLITWLVAVGYWRFGQVEDRYGRIGAGVTSCRGADGTR